jgi:hypothetical protein
MTKAERSLVADGELDVVLRIRQKFQRTVRADPVGEDRADHWPQGGRVHE